MSSGDDLLVLLATLAGNSLLTKTWTAAKFNQLQAFASTSFIYLSVHLFVSVQGSLIHIFKIARSARYICNSLFCV